MECAELALPLERLVPYDNASKLGAPSYSSARLRWSPMTMRRGGPSTFASRIENVAAFIANIARPNASLPKGLSRSLHETSPQPVPEVLPMQQLCKVRKCVGMLLKLARRHQKQQHQMDWFPVESVELNSFS